MDYMKKTPLILLFCLVAAATLAALEARGGSDSLRDMAQAYRSVEIMRPGASPSPIPWPAEPVRQYCAKDPSFFSPADSALCGKPPFIQRAKHFEIDLTDNRILAYEQGMLRATLPVAYQAPYGKWFQTPTGYFHAGVKKPKFMSSITPVYMEDAVQLYEDFFVHNIPYHPDGTKVTSQFSGGCIRLEDDVARRFYDMVQTGDDIVSYTLIRGLSARQGLTSPVSQDGFWIRQRFNSPLRNDWARYEDKRDNYIQHAGVDLSPVPGTPDRSAKAIADGAVAKIVRNGSGDAGLGNAVIISFKSEGSTLYALYGHLASISESLREGGAVKLGDTIGIVGNTGYGCNYWQIGEDGCNKGDEPDAHLHFEIKTEPTLGSPEPDTCKTMDGRTTPCIGYTTDNPTDFGYRDPLLIIFENAGA
jgi:hypothetical protein